LIYKNRILRAQMSSYCLNTLKQKLQKEVLDNKVDGMKIQRVYTLQKRGYEACGKNIRKVKKGEVIPVHATKTQR